MTMATLEELLGGTPADHVHLERYGYREEEVGDGRYYVGRSDRGMAIMLKRHRPKGWRGWGRKKKKKVVLPEQGRTMKITIDQEAVREASRSMAKATESLKTIDFSKLATYTPPPQKEPGMFRKVANWCEERWYDEAWHKGARNTAGTVLMWGFTVLALVTFGRGMAWVVFGI